MYFDAAVVFVTSQTFLLRLTVLTKIYLYKLHNKQEQNSILAIFSGFCDNVLSEKQLFEITKSSIQSNVTYIDKVLIICSGRIENVQVKAIKQCMNWLSYNNHKENFCFIYNKCDELKETEKLENLAYMCDVLETDLTKTVEYSKNNQSYKIQMNLALGFPRHANYEDVKNDHEKLINSTITHFSDGRIEIKKSSCVIL